jgi:mannose-6-phosphate isomerase-like protein (cupin superfamily)
MVTMAACFSILTVRAWGEAGKSYASADEVQAMIAAGKSGLLASLGAYKAELETRVAPQAAPMTQDQDELIYVVSGRGTLIMGGAPLPLEKGAAVFVPAKTEWQITKINRSLATISMRLPISGGTTEEKANTFASVKDFKGLVAAGKNDTLVALPPYRDVFQYRKEPQNALLHQQDDEFVYVAQGSGTFTVGGTLNDSKPTTPGNSSGSGITGGTSYKVAPGAVIFVPANTPHQFSGISGALISIDLHLPHAN